MKDVMLSLWSFPYITKKCFQKSFKVSLISYVEFSYDACVYLIA
jgi:hypothetical protein